MFGSPFNFSGCSQLIFLPKGDRDHLLCFTGLLEGSYAEIDRKTFYKPQGLSPLIEQIQENSNEKGSENR
jgi:hypothetical protein